MTTTNDDTAKQEEARNLAHEAVAAERAGDPDEAEFLMDAAKDLDKKAAKATARQDRGKGGGGA